MTKGYSSKSNAKRAAEKTGTPVDNFDFTKGADGKWYFAEKTSCVEQPNMVTVGIHSGEQDPNKHGENIMPDEQKNDAVAAAKAAAAVAKTALSNAIDEADQLKEDVKGFQDSVKDAKAQLKKAQAYHSSLGDDAEDKEQAAGIVTSWEEALQTRQADLETAKAAAKAAKDGVTAAKKASREADKAVTKASKPVKTPRAEREERNGMKRPSAGTISETLWNLFDTVSQELERPAAIGDVMERALAAGVKEASVKAGYAHWRKFHGISGRVMSEEQVAAAKAKEEEKARKQAEKAAAKAAAEAAPEAATEAAE